MTTGVAEPDSDGEVMFEPFELQPSLVDAVEAVCPEHEAEEMWQVIGPSLVEQAKDLLQEAKLHLEIWRELTNRDTDHATSRELLPEPPMVRERLLQEIRFLANHLKSRAGSSTLESSTDRSREVLSYALTATPPHSQGGGRVSSAQRSRPQSVISSRDGRETPLRRSTPSSQDGSRSSVFSWEDRAALEHVSLTTIDSTVQHLRELLEEEIIQRKEDIAFLQECTEGERSIPPLPPPSLRELRSLGTLLEREVTSGTTRSSPSNQLELTPTPPPGECPQTTLTRRPSRFKSCPLQLSSTHSISSQTLQHSNNIIIKSSRYQTITSTVATPLNPIS